MASLSSISADLTSPPDGLTPGRLTTAKKESIELAAHALKSMAHPLRLEILCVLGNQEICVLDLVEAVGTSQSNVSQHLAILRNKGVIASRKTGNHVFYRIADHRIMELIDRMREVFCPSH